MNRGEHTLLVCTLGGTIEPLVASLLHWRPARVFFIPSPETRARVDAVLVEYSKRVGQPLGPGQYDIQLVRDRQSIQDCLRAIGSLNPEIQKWLARGDDYQVVADFTGGTKCMTAALALAAARWRCVFSYVGGESRTKEGLGVVQTGSEKVLPSENPWEALGYRAIDEFVILFDQRAYASAKGLAGRAKDLMESPPRRHEFAVLEKFADGLDDWDRFDHVKARGKLGEVLESANDIKASLGAAAGDRVTRFIAQHQEHLERLGAQHGWPSVDHVKDLLANASRRKEEGRIDDAVARLYRVIEAIAQCALAERHRIPSTSRVLIAQLPEPLRSRPELRPDEDGTVKLGLQDAYALLTALEDRTGAKFTELGLNDRKGPLAARNNSILAHGLQKVSPKVFDRLWSAALDLAEMKAEDLPIFPKLGGE